MTLGLVAAGLNALYGTTFNTVPVTCGAETARVFWNETGTMVPDQSGDFVPSTDRHFRYRAWTLMSMVQGSTVTVTFPARAATESDRTVSYVVRTIFPMNDGNEHVARVTPVVG